MISIDQTVISRIEHRLLRTVRLHQVARLLCVLAPEVLEVRVRQDGTIQEAQTWEPFEPPILAPPISLDYARPSRQPRSPRGRRPRSDEDLDDDLVDAAEGMAQEDGRDGGSTESLRDAAVDAAEGIAERDSGPEGSSATVGDAE